MPRVDVARSQIQLLRRAVPFQPFVLNLENGDRIIIEHPENIAFEPTAADGTGGSEAFAVISRKFQHYGNFAAVTSVALVDRGELAK